MTKKVGITATMGLLILLTFLLSSTYETEGIAFEVQEFDDVEYAGNPDIGYRSDSYQENFLENGVLKRTNNSFFDFEFQTNSDETITLKNIDLTPWIPSLPKALSENDYLAQLAIINQEWNRNQIAFHEGEFETDITKIVRVDLARNCLNSYLWELIVFTKEGETVLPYAHGWFNFPKQTYQELFNANNPKSFDVFAEHLEQWKSPASKVVNKEILRELIEDIPVRFQDSSDEMYLLLGERAKKRNSIVSPKSFSTMRDLQSDQTLFATFSPPGIYDTSDPRKTQLGRISVLDSVILRKTKQQKDIEFHEIEMRFSDMDKNRSTKLILGGLDFEEIPVLKNEEAHKGWQNSMGFGNHSFYENYADRIQTVSNDIPYYGYLTDEVDNWLDSHEVGIDGPLLYFENSSKTKLHIWLLSFERHALVGHYIIDWEAATQEALTKNL